jgi:hypothetical protein
MSGSALNVCLQYYELEVAELGKRLIQKSDLLKKFMLKLIFSMCLYCCRLLSMLS